MELHLRGSLGGNKVAFLHYRKRQTSILILYYNMTFTLSTVVLWFQFSDQGAINE